MRELAGDTTFRKEERFLEAIQKGRVEVVRQLPGEGCNPNRGKTYGETTLFDAISFGQTAVVELLLKAGA